MVYFGVVYNGVVYYGMVYYDMVYYGMVYHCTIPYYMYKVLWLRQCCYKFYLYFDELHDTRS